MADSREIGMRVGAATNQAVSIVAADPELRALDSRTVGAYVEEMAEVFLGIMDHLQAKSSGAAVATPVAQVQQRYSAPQQPAAPTQAQAIQSVTQAFPGTQEVQQQFTGAQQAPSGFSGSSKPLRLAEHPELPGWLQAQAAAVGVAEVWDNRGKPNYIAAVNSGAKTTPPPFRSATQGVDKSFWPPK